MKETRSIETRNHFLVCERCHTKFYGAVNDHVCEHRTIEQRLAKPKKGDAVSMAFSYAGLTSWEKWTVDKVSRDGDKLWIDGQIYNKLGEVYVYTDSTIGPCSKTLYLDGGKRADDYAREQEKPRGKRRGRR